MFKNYKLEQDYLKELCLSKKTIFINYIIAILIALLIMSGPLCILINLLIFRDYQMIISFGIATCIALIIWITNLIYYKSIQKNNTFKYLIIVDSSIFTITVYLCVLIMVFMGVF